MSEQETERSIPGCGKSAGVGPPDPVFFALTCGIQDVTWTIGGRD